MIINPGILPSKSYVMPWFRAQKGSMIYVVLHDLVNFKTEFAQIHL
jgi:hypothetical protein